jgi:diguanylate cyclase (GGDEF)-like protein
MSPDLTNSSVTTVLSHPFEEICLRSTIRKSTNPQGPPKKTARRAFRENRRIFTTPERKEIHDALKAKQDCILKQRRRVRHDHARRTVMITPENKESSTGETDKERLDGLLSVDVLTIDLVSAFAGDRSLNKDEARILELKKNNLGNGFYSELLYTISHQHFQPDIAQSLWLEIIRHKYEMSVALKRNIRIVVAALDYLSNITGTIIATTLISEEHIADIVDSSIRDGLTGLFNHAFFFRRTEIEIKRSIQSAVSVSLMMIDIDDFKAFNDRYGHQEGDAILHMIGTIIKAETRQADFCCRYGGEEFGVVLPGADMPEARSLAERLRGAVEAGLPADRKLTVSIGIATMTRARDCFSEDLIGRADEALYEAKATGKNRVVSREWPERNGNG